MVYSKQPFRLNVDNTQKTIFTTKASPAVQDCDENVKIIGLTLDKKLNSKPHMRLIVGRIRNLVSDSSFSVIVCISGPIHHNRITLFRLQKKVVRAIARTTHLERCMPYFIKLQILEQ